MTTWLTGGGEMGALIRARDWSRSPLGPLEGWQQSLRTAVGMLLASRAQIILFWGPDFVVLYNDAYRPVFGGKHPDAIGRAGHDARSTRVDPPGAGWSAGGGRGVGAGWRPLAVAPRSGGGGGGGGAGPPPSSPPPPPPPPPILPPPRARARALPGPRRIAISC